MTDTLSRADVYLPEADRPTYELVDALGSAYGVLIEAQADDVMLMSLEDRSLQKVVDFRDKIGAYLKTISHAPLNEETVRQIAIDWVTLSQFSFTCEGVLASDEELPPELADLFEDEIKEKINQFTGKEEKSPLEPVENSELSRQIIMAVMKMGNNPFTDIERRVNESELGELLEEKNTKYRWAA
jgi:hypothetical protein